MNCCEQSYMSGKQNGCVGMRTSLVWVLLFPKINCVLIYDLYVWSLTGCGQRLKKITLVFNAWNFPPLFTPCFNWKNKQNSLIWPFNSIFRTRQRKTTKWCGCDYLYSKNLWKQEVSVKKWTGGTVRCV